MTIIITDTASQSRRHVEWGLEGPLTYNASTSLLIESDNLVTSGFAGTQTTLAGAYDVGGGNTVVSATLYTTQPIAVCGTGNLSHVGSFRVKARVHGGNIGDLVRLSWQALDGPRSTNPWADLQQNGLWEELDLGTITIPAATVGTQRWTGQIEAQGVLAGTSLTVDYLILIPVSDGYGKARAVAQSGAGVITGFDAFTGTTSGSALNTRVASLGGTWATSGDATDFAFTDLFDGVTGEGIQRSTTAVETNGRYAILGSSNYTDVQIDVRGAVSNAAMSANVEQAVIARWTDSSNYLRLIGTYAPGTGLWSLRLEQVVAAAVTVLASAAWDGPLGSPYHFRLVVFASGHAIGRILTDAGAVAAEVEATSSALATGGTLATGKPGLRDRSLAAVTTTRAFTDFTLSTPAAEPIVLYSGRNMQIRHDIVERQDSTGTYSGRPPSYRGSRFLVPVGTSRVLVKARRNDIETGADENVTDALQIQVAWTIRGLAVPR